MKPIDNKDAFSIASQLLSEGESVSIRVKGQSMLPFFRSGSVVTLRPIRPVDLSLGHVVLGLTETGNYVIHRIISVCPPNVTLLGDGNIKGTEVIPIDQIFGTVDCGRLHYLLARLWIGMRPLRRYPLWFLRRIFPE